MRSTGEEAVLACRGKKLYPSYSAAKRVVKRIYRSIDKTDCLNGHMHAYKCRQCASWHLGGGIEEGRRKR